MAMLTSTISGITTDPREDRYPFPSLWINGRTVPIERIVDGREVGQTPFEGNTFTFIRDWLAGEERFETTTSGSTGAPKVISLTRSQMIASATSTCQKLNIQKGSTALLCIDPRYIGGKMMLVRCLVHGLPIMAVEPSANPLVRIPVDKCVQFTAFVPYQVTSMLESKHPHLLNSPDVVLIGGAALNTATAEQLDKYHCLFFETYGMTETLSHIAIRLVNTPMKQPYFETLPGVNITKDDRGCLVITAGYLPEPVITNDLVEIVAPGKFRWLGRWDSVINTGGVKVIPEKIEKELDSIFHKNGLHHRFFIAGSPDEKLGNKIVLVIEGVQISSELLDASLSDLKAAVSPFELPKEVYTIPEFALTRSQKIDRINTLAGVTLLSPSR